THKYDPASLIKIISSYYIRMKTILFYGNCNLSAIKKILNIKDYLQYDIVCFDTEITKDDFDAIIKKCDIIITQPIKDNYRDKQYLAANYIIQNAKDSCEII